MVWGALFLLIICLVIVIYDLLAHIKESRSETDIPTSVNYARGLTFLLLIYLAIRVYDVSVLLILVVLTLGSLVVWGGYRLWHMIVSHKQADQDPLLVDYARSLLPVFVIVLVIRSFLFQPFRVPSGSLEPTVEPGDFVLVSQYAYGLRLPVINSKIVDTGEPKRGDIVVFHYPVDTNVDFIKRVIGLPGDHIQYKNKQLTINGHTIKQTFLSNTVDEEEGQRISAKIFRENLLGVKHRIMQYPYAGPSTHFDFTVPKGYYFVMGDNRDGSADSRYWGFVPESDLVGKALFVWFHWGDDGIKWSRIGKTL